KSCNQHVNIKVIISVLLNIIEASNDLSPEAIGLKGEIILSNLLLRIRSSLKTSVFLGFKSCPPRSRPSEPQDGS
ncbi:hypothetical protein NR224_10795, partial [Pediococcus ethanolidurans]|uniref:hypothetical protein n=1 Tax=Pediococcus ethanolidurans TaxID=319653 RepID=UPI0021E7375C